jgi:hypothetical protein
MTRAIEPIFHDPGVVPGTHALVIGIGQYPHLMGGDSPAQKTDGMRQLSSPPMSARAVADWLLQDYHCPGKELSSLALLTSEPASAPFTNPRTATTSEVPTAEIAAIVAAIKEWKRLGDASAGNRLIFYFCGHGISQGNDMALLASDFSLDDDNPLESALDFSMLVNGLRKCQASEQIFIIDACRASSDVLIGQITAQMGRIVAGEVPLLGGPRPTDLPRCEAVTYYSTLAGDLSHARPHSVSLFTDATLRALHGAGSDNPNDDEEWWVNTSRLHEAIDHFMKQPVFAGQVAGVQTPAVNGMPVFRVHQLTGPPIVPVYVGCEPQEANGTAEFVCRQGDDEKFRRAVGELGADPAGRWHLNLEFGRYEFEARLAPNDVRVRAKEVRPIFGEIKLRPVGTP